MAHVRGPGPPGPEVGDPPVTAVTVTRPTRARRPRRGGDSQGRFGRPAPKALTILQKVRKTMGCRTKRAKSIEMFRTARELPCGFEACTADTALTAAMMNVHPMTTRQRQRPKKVIAELATTRAAEKNAWQRRRMTRATDPDIINSSCIT